MWILSHLRAWKILYRNKFGRGEYVICWAQAMHNQGDIVPAHHRGHQEAFSYREVACLLAPLAL